MPSKILYIGATGYIGGSAIVKILDHPRRKDFDITVLIRDSNKAAGFESLGLKTVEGSLSDFDLLERLASESEIVFQTADADDLDATKAILKGLKNRFEQTKKPASLIHTSGTGVLLEDTKGNSKTEKIYYDDKVEDIESLDDRQPHRLIDLAVVEADKEGYIKSYIVLPSTIWGIASNVLTEKGLQNPKSLQIPTTIQISIDRGSTPLIGKGLNVWPRVHHEEVAEFYYILFNAVISSKEPPHGREGFYFLENEEYSQKEVADVVAQYLYKLGKVNSDRPSVLTPQELEKYPSAWFAGTNSRCRGVRPRSLGWNPTKTASEFFASVEIEVDFFLNKSV